MNGEPATDGADAVSRSATEMVALDILLQSDSPRLSGTNSEHIRALAESDAELPPILVNRKTMRIVDGAHRVSAAILRGQSEIAAEFCDCDDAEAFVLAVEANVAHGLPLSLTDRTAAARRITESHGHWSNRAIAAVAGLSHKTVGSIRRRASGDFPQSNARMGLDGRVRPVNAAEGRTQAATLLSCRPDASLREIAKAAGVSPATVRDVRARMERSGDPVPLSRREAGSSDSPRATPKPPSVVSTAPAQTDISVLLQRLRRDPSLRFSEAGRALLRMLEVSCLPPEEWARIVDNVPTHCAENVTAAAWVCIKAWQDFAGQLELRRRQCSAG